MNSSKGETTKFALYSTLHKKREPALRKFPFYIFDY